ncbi:MAG: hypothetical protein H6609_17000 [Ignavibacteriales bacterium]|nr:hypothetical protein [Ignavibacteriales bacterium]
MRINDFYNSIKDQRYLSVIIHSKPNKDLSDFAKKSADVLHAKYFNLFSYFSENIELAESIDSFTDQSLIELFYAQAENNSILIIDQVDFLLDTWDKVEQKNFFNLFDKQWDTWKLSNRTGLILFVETNGILDSADIKFQNGTKKIYELNEFISL